MTKHSKPVSQSKQHWKPSSYKRERIMQRNIYITLMSPDVNCSHAVGNSGKKFL
jgi:hypothetical protein